jgi:hypothetical protein
MKSFSRMSLWEWLQFLWVCLLAVGTVSRELVRRRHHTSEELLDEYERECLQMRAMSQKWLRDHSVSQDENR